MLKAWTLLKTNTATDALTIIYRKFSEKAFLRAAPDRYF